MSLITIILIIIIALLAGMEGILDEFQFHQPLVACTLIGLVSGHLTEGIILGGSLQMIALGWANVGAAVAPDAALASVASSIIMVLGLEGGATDVQTAISTAIAVAIPLSPWLSGGMTVGGGMVAAVGYAMVINMMSTKETWPFFALGFVLAAIGELTLIALGAIGVALAIIYLGLKENSGSNGGGSTGSGDPLGDILNDY